MEEKIRKRIVELEQAEEQKRLELTVIAHLLAELRGLLRPVLSGDPLGEIEDVGGESRSAHVNGVGAN